MQHEFVRGGLVARTGQRALQHNGDLTANDKNAQASVTDLTERLKWEGAESATEIAAHIQKTPQLKTLLHQNRKHESDQAASTHDDQERKKDTHLAQQLQLLEAGQREGRDGHVAQLLDLGLRRVQALRGRRKAPARKHESGA